VRSGSELCLSGTAWSYEAPHDVRLANPGARELYRPAPFRTLLGHTSPVAAKQPDFTSSNGRTRGSFKSAPRSPRQGGHSGGSAPSGERRSGKLVSSPESSSRSRKPSPVGQDLGASASLQAMQEMIEAYLRQRPDVRNLYKQQKRAVSRDATVELCRELEEQEEGLFRNEAADLRRQLVKQDSQRSRIGRPSRRLLEAMLRVAADGDHPVLTANLHDALEAAEEEIVSLAEVLSLSWEALSLDGSKVVEKITAACRCSWKAQVPQRRRRSRSGRRTQSTEPAQATPSRAIDAAEEQLRAQQQRREEGVAMLDAALAEVASVNTKCLASLQLAKVKLTETLAEARLRDLSECDLAAAEKRRKHIHNIIEDLKGSIRVFCRVRPLTLREAELGDGHVMRHVDAMTLEVDGAQFTFDASFMPGTQEEVFEDCKGLVQSALDGYHVTLFAYGQTSAGKTYTTFGTPGQPGLAPRIAEEIFRTAKCDAGRISYSVFTSMLELYRNDLIDLLTKNKQCSFIKKPAVRVDKAGKVYIENVVEEQCKDAIQLMSLIEMGNQQRTIAATMMNSESSRSHLLLNLRLVATNTQTGEQTQSKIMLCDLAGSERLKKSYSTGNAAKESIEINKSLTALGDVIEALTQGSKQVPYRNHKLTQILQDSLGGSSKTLMFVTCSPASSNLDETLMSLKWATRAKNIPANKGRVSGSGVECQPFAVLGG